MSPYNSRPPTSSSGWVRTLAKAQPGGGVVGVAVGVAVGVLARVGVGAVVGVLANVAVAGATVGAAASGTVVVIVGIPVEAEIGFGGKALAGAVGRLVIAVPGESETAAAGAETAGLSSEGAGAGIVATEPATGSGAVMTDSVAIATASGGELAVGVSVGKGVRVSVGKRVIIMESATD
jgi:hypothetical protein